MPVLGLYLVSYLIRLIFAMITIGYAMNIPWAIFFVVTHFILSVMSAYLTTLAVSALIVYGIIFHYGVPWWYMLLIGQNVFLLWEYRSIQDKVRSGELDELEADRRFESPKRMADIVFYIGAIGLLYQCYQRFFS